MHSWPLLFIQPVVDAFDPRLLVAPAIFHTLDFSCIKVCINYLEIVNIYSFDMHEWLSFSAIHLCTLVHKY